MRKKSKYKPRPVVRDTLNFVLNAMTPVTAKTDALLTLKVKNSEAMLSLLQGKATKSDMDTLINMSNMVEQLVQDGFGTEYKSASTGGRIALMKIIERANEVKRFTPTGPEITLLQTMMELHDAQMEVITVRDFAKAGASIIHQIENNINTIKMDCTKELA